MGIRWNHGLCSGGVEVDGSSVSRLTVRRCGKGSLGFSFWSWAVELCLWLGRGIATFFDSRGRSMSCVSLRAVPLTELVRLLLKVVLRYSTISTGKFTPAETGRCPRTEVYLSHRNLKYI